jgi:hypothetical protein
MSSALEPPTASVVRLPPYEPPSTISSTAYNQEGTAILPATDDIKSGSVTAISPLKHDGLFSALPPSSPPVAQSSLSSGYSATFLSSMFKPADTTADPPVYSVRAFTVFLPATAMQLEASKHRVQRLASASFDVEVAASLLVIATPRCTPGAIGSSVRVTDSLKRNRRLRYSRTDVGDSEGASRTTALQVASAGGHDKIVEMLLAKDVDVNAQGGVFRNALRAAKRHDRIVALLLARGVDNNVPRTASTRANASTVQLLVNHFRSLFIGA